MNVTPRPQDRLTVWSFIPVGILAPITLGLAFAVSPPGRDENADEDAMWSIAFFLFHFLAALGCVRASIRFLWQRRGTLSKGEAICAWSFLILSVVYLSAWAVVVLFYQDRFGSGR